MIQVQALITKIEVLESGYYHFTLLAPGIAGIAKPGQFVQVSVAGPGANDPLLPRPVSIYRIRQAEGKIELLFKTAGRGTRMLAAKKTGERITILGPAGNGFTMPDGVQNIALIAGGIGMPPLYCLAEKLTHSGYGGKLTLFYGGRTKADLLALDLWEKNNIKAFLATEDGSAGFKGFVTDVFLEQNNLDRFELIISCGPVPMLKTVQKISENTGIPGEISLEAYMACGVGACLGCVCKTTTGYKRVCADGPVFSMNGVTFNE